MGRLTHVPWSIFYEQLDCHGYFTIWLHLNQNNAKFNSRLGQKGSNFQNLFLKTKTCFWSRISSAIQWCHQFSCNWATTFKKLHLNVWRHHLALECWWQKYPFWGSKIIVSSWNFAHWLKTVSSTTYIPFFENIEHFWFCGHLKSDFLFFWGSATPERVTFQRASFERTIFSDCTFERLTIGAIHHLSECHFSDYRMQRVPISTQPIWASIPRLTGTVWAKAI